MIIVTKMGNFKFESGQIFICICDSEFSFPYDECVLCFETLGGLLGAFDYLGGVFHRVYVCCGVYGVNGKGWDVGEGCVDWGLSGSVKY